MLRTKRKPTSPGEILQEEFLTPLNLTQKELADHIKCDVKVINRIVNEQCRLTAEMGVRLAAALNTSIEFWLNAQEAVDIYYALENTIDLPTRIVFPLKKVG
jgi:addiction module HigA family antidote